MLAMLGDQIMLYASEYLFRPLCYCLSLILKQWLEKTLACRHRRRLEMSRLSRSYGNHCKTLAFPRLIDVVVSL